MSQRFAMLLLSGALGFSAAGCVNTSPLTRAQSPQVHSDNWGQTAVVNSYCQQGHGQNVLGCPACSDPSQRINLPFHPVHRNSFTVNAPKNMMYPPSPSQAGVVQYPYYTFRGPTDFFMQ